MIEEDGEEVVDSVEGGEVESSVEGEPGEVGRGGRKGELQFEPIALSCGMLADPERLKTTHRPPRSVEVAGARTRMKRNSPSPLVLAVPSLDLLVGSGTWDDVLLEDLRALPLLDTGNLEDLSL